MPKRKRTGQRAYAAPQGGYAPGSDSDNSDSDKSNNGDSEEKKAGAPVPTEHRFITVNRTRPPPTALAVLRQSSRRIRRFKRQRVPLSMLHPSGYIPSGRNLLAATGITICNAGTNLKDLFSGFGTGVKEVAIELTRGVTNIVVAGIAALPPVAQATVPWVAQATIALSTLTGLALQNPGSATALAGLGQVLRRGGLMQAFWANLGYAPT